MAFGQQSGPPASAKQVKELLTLLKNLGHSDFRDARGPMGFTQRQAAGKFTRDMRVHVADASMIGTVDAHGLAALDGCARGLTPGRGFAPRCGLGSLGLLLALGVKKRQCDQKGREANPDFPARNRIGKFHGYLPSFLCVWFSALISFTLIFEAPAGGSKVKRKSGSFVWKSQLEKIAVYSGVPSSSL